MVSRKKDRRYLQSRQAIVEAGITALLANPEAGMSQIAQAAGIGRATLYRHFESREDLIKELVLVCYQEIDEALAPYENLHGRAAIDKIIDILMPMADRFRFLINLWSFIEDDKDLRRVEARMDQEMADVFDQAKAAGELNDILPTWWLVAFFNSTLMAAWTLIDSGSATSKEATQYMKQSFFSGCGSK